MLLREEEGPCQRSGEDGCRQVEGQGAQGWAIDMHKDQGGGGDGGDGWEGEKET